MSIEIRLGNPLPRCKRREPLPAELLAPDATPEQLADHAAGHRGMDAARVRAVAEQHGMDAARDAVESTLVEYKLWDGPECTTTVRVSPQTEAALDKGDSKTLMAEVQKIWALSARKPPTWVSSSSERVATLIAAVLGAAEIRPWQENTDED